MSLALGADERALPLWRRLWIYQGERIPLLKTAVLTAVFASAGVTLSALLAGRVPPAWPTYLIASLVTLCLFVILRVCDEYKDAETDRLHRPERPVPRGLVTLGALRACGLVAGAAALLLAGSLGLGVALVLLAVFLYMALMAVEFFVPHWLGERPLLYLVSHMMVMPLIDFFVTACEWLPRAGAPPAGLAVFLVLSFVNGTVLEIGRKTWAPALERSGVETYSALMGPRRAVLAWMALVVLAFLLVAAVAWQIGTAFPVALLAGAALAAALAIATLFLRNPTPKLTKALDTASGLWVLVSYAGLGLLPLVVGRA